MFFATVLHRLSIVPALELEHEQRVFLSVLFLLDSSLLLFKQDKALGIGAVALSALV